jgi:hypothetical protein
MALSEHELRTLRAIEAQLEADRHRLRTWVRSHAANLVLLLLATSAAIAAVVVSACMAPGAVAAPVSAAAAGASTWLWCNRPRH